VKLRYEKANIAILLRKWQRRSEGGDGIHAVFAADCSLKTASAPDAPERVKASYNSMPQIQHVKPARAVAFVQAAAEPA
jgi:hypothetical protein